MEGITAPSDLQFEWDTFFPTYPSEALTIVSADGSFEAGYLTNPKPRTDFELTIRTQLFSISMIIMGLETAH